MARRLRFEEPCEADVASVDSSPRVVEGKKRGRTTSKPLPVKPGLSAAEARRLSDEISGPIRARRAAAKKRRDEEHKSKEADKAADKARKVAREVALMRRQWTILVEERVVKAVKAGHKSTTLGPIDVSGKSLVGVGTAADHVQDAMVSRGFKVSIRMPQRMRLSTGVYDDYSTLSIKVSW